MLKVNIAARTGYVRALTARTVGHTDAALLGMMRRTEATMGKATCRGHQGTTHPEAKATASLESHTRTCVQRQDQRWLSPREDAKLQMVYADV